jgi:predicted kinase
MKFRDFLREQKEKSAVLAFGRMNPITNGHEKLVYKVKQVAKQVGGSHHIVLSHSQDPKKNPLSVAQKLKHAKNAFPGTNFIAASKDAPTFFEHAEKLYKQGVTDFHMVGGSDRSGEFAKLLRKYNGTHEGARFNFKRITVHTSGERDPDAEGVEGISASKMREAAKNNDFDTFKKGAPSKMSQAHVKQMFNDVRKGMNLKEEVELNENDLNRFSKYIIKPVKTEPKIVRKTNPAGRTSDHVEYEVHGTISSQKRTFKSKKDAEAYYHTVKEETLTEGVHDKGIFKAVFLGGGPGSGKDYVLSNTLDGHGLTEINSDKALEYLMDKEDLDKKMPESEEKQRNEVRKRAKNITELRQRLALHGRNGIIINGTGDDVEKYRKIKEKLEALGYETKMVMVNTADEVSRQRNVERGQRGGRTVPEDIRKEKWDAVQASRVEHAKTFGDNYVEFDNSEDLRSAPPEVVEAKTKELQSIFKDVQKFVAAAPKNDQSKQWIANELGKKDTAPVKKSVEPHADAGHQEEGNKLGLEYYGFGRYGKNGKVTHRSVHGKLVEIEKKQKETPELPVMGSGSASTKELQLKPGQKKHLQDLKSKSKLPKTKNESTNDKFENFLSEAVTVTITGDTAEEVSKTFKLLRSDEEEMTEQEEVNTMSDSGAYNLLRLGMPLIKEDLRNWFDPKHPEGGWKRINSKGEAIGPCAREPGEAKPKCMSNEKRASLSKKERASAVAAKRRHDPNPERKGEPINVSSFGKGKISEAAYEGNIGMMEVMKFHQKATPEQKKKFKEHLANKNHKEAWKMIQHVSGTKLIGKQFEETETKKQKLLSDRHGKPRTFLLRASAAKEAHVNGGTVHKVGSKYVIKIKEDRDEVYSPTNNAIEAVYGQNSSTPSAKQLGKVGTSSRGKDKPRLDKPVAEERRTISLSSIKENFQKKIEESIDKGIEPGLSMAASGESPARDMGEKLSKKGKATQVVPKNISELTGDETTASIGDQKEDELKKKGISLTTFKKRNYV